jgi:hypothetical protein
MRDTIKKVLQESINQKKALVIVRNLIGIKFNIFIEKPSSSKYFGPVKRRMRPSAIAMYKADWCSEDEYVFSFNFTPEDGFELVVGQTDLWEQFNSYIDMIDMSICDYDCGYFDNDDFVELYSEYPDYFIILQDGQTFDGQGS